MKDGRTHLAHKAEHAVDMETGAVLAVTLQDANAGDTTTIQQTLIAVAEQMEKLTEDAETAQQIAENWLAELVTDKGYHSNETMVDLKEFEIRSYISEPKRGRRNWIGKASGTRCRLRQSAADSRRARQKLIASSRTHVGTAICSLLRNRSNEASSPARPREYSQTAPHSCRWIQFESGAAPDDRQRNSARSSGPRDRLLPDSNRVDSATLAGRGCRQSQRTLDNAQLRYPSFAETLPRNHYYFHGLLGNEPCFDGHTS